MAKQQTNKQARVVPFIYSHPCTCMLSALCACMCVLLKTKLFQAHDGIDRQRIKFASCCMHQSFQCERLHSEQPTKYKMHCMSTCKASPSKMSLQYWSFYCKANVIRSPRRVFQCHCTRLAATCPTWPSIGPPAPTPSRNRPGAL